MIAIAHDTLKFSQSINASLSAVWVAFSDSAQRSVWGAPAGDAQVYDESDFREGGRDVYRCGPPRALDFHGVVNYMQIVPGSLIVHTDTVVVKDQLLAIALLTWQFETHGATTQVRLTDQVTSFVGSDMIAGQRNGHTKALEQLCNFVEGREGKRMKAGQ